MTQDQDTKTNDRDLLRLESIANLLKNICTVFEVAATIGGIDESVFDEVNEIRHSIDSVMQDMRPYLQGTNTPVDLDDDIRRRARKIFETLADRTEPLWAAMTAEAALSDYIKAELAKPKYSGKKYKDIASSGTDENGRIIKGSLYEQLFKAAKKARDKEIAASTGAKKELQPVRYVKKNNIELTLDGLTVKFFEANAPAPPDPPPAKGQTRKEMAVYPVKYGETESSEIELYYTYSFDDSLFNQKKLKKEIDDEDYFILSFIASYWRAGENLVSVSKLYRDLTGENPNQKQLTALTNRLYKIAGTNIFIDSKDVRQAWHIEDVTETFQESLIPLASIAVGAEYLAARGQVTKATMKIYAEPEIMKLGFAIGQITTVPQALLHVKKKNGRKLTRTLRFYRVLHYLIRRIAAIKNGNLAHKLLYKTFYEEIGETTIRDKQLALNCMYTILDHFKNCDWITGYREETTPTTGDVGVRITCPASEEASKKKKLTTKKKASIKN